MTIITNRRQHHYAVKKLKRPRFEGHTRLGSGHLRCVREHSRGHLIKSYKTRYLHHNQPCTGKAGAEASI